jgi:2-aminoadipate transaminase
MRLGWIQVNPKSNLMNIFNDCGTLFSGGGLNSYTSLIVESSMKLKLFDNHLEMLIKEYSSRLDILCDAIIQYDDKKLFSFDKPKGGYFLWIVLNSQINTELFYQQLEQNKVIVMPGSDNSIENNSFPNCIRLCFAFVSKDELIEGSKRICQAANKSFNISKL